MRGHHACLASFCNAAPACLARCGLLLVALGFTGCAPPQSAEQLILYSIDGRGVPTDQTPVGESFHGYPVLGKLEIADAADRQKILSTVAQGIAESDGTMARCFWPRHALHSVQQGRVVDYIICFECLQMQIDDGSAVMTKPTTRHPESTLNEYLTRARIPIAP